MTTRNTSTATLIAKRLTTLIAHMPSSMLSGSPQLTPPSTPAVTSPPPKQPAPQSNKPCTPCQAFNKISHITGLVQEAANSCTPEGLPKGVGGTIQVAAAECDDMIRGLSSEKGFDQTVAALQQLRPKLSWVGTCEDAQEATELALAARHQTHQDAVSYFRRVAT